MPLKTTYYLLDRYRSVDINTEQDFKFAAFLNKFLDKTSKTK
jgi:CMP-N-acetylneuraminic acid synthetase